MVANVLGCVFVGDNGILLGCLFVDAKLKLQNINLGRS